MDVDNNGFEVVKVKEEVEDPSYHEFNTNYEVIKVKEEVEDASYHNIKQESIEDDLSNTFIKQECKLEVDWDCTEDEHLVYDENLKKWTSTNVNSTKNCYEQQFFQCPECSVKTKYEANLNKHISFMHSKKKFLNKEWMQDKTGEKNDELLRKENSWAKHNGGSSSKAELLSKRKFTFSCNYCSFCSNVKFKFIYHVYQCHYSKNNNLKSEIFVCPYCAKQYLHKQKERHLAYCKETFSNYLQCDYCTYYFKGKGSLRKHIFKIHLKDGTLKNIKENQLNLTMLQPCPKCGRRYQYSSSLSKHIVNCGKKHHFQCNTCLFTTNDQYSLSAHVLQHLKKSNLCLDINYGPTYKN